MPFKRPSTASDSEGYKNLTIKLSASRNNPADNRYFTGISDIMICLFMIKLKLGHKYDKTKSIPQRMLFVLSYHEASVPHHVHLRQSLQ